MVSTPLGENVRIDRVYNGCPILVCGMIMCANLVELPMHDFDIILCMDWLHKCFAFMDCRRRVVRFCFRYDEELVWVGYNSIRPNPFISNLISN